MSTGVEAPTRAALIHDWLTGMRGGEKVLAALASLVPDAPIYTLVHVPGSIDASLASRSIHTSWIERLPGARRTGAQGGYRRYLPLFPAAIEDFDLTGYDLVLSTSHCVAKGVIPAPGARHLCYCHSPMRYAWDQEHVYFPKRRGLTARLRNLLLSQLRTWDVASAHRVDTYVANSRFVARRIARYYGRDAVVIPPPVDLPTFTGTSANDKKAYEAESPSDRCLMVAALAPYKRVDVAIAACQRLGLGLDVVGTGPELRTLEQNAGEHVRLLGHVPQDHLSKLFRDALCFVQPGVEDFGIAAVESLASGTPVVALGRGGVLDIIEDGQHGVLYGTEDRRIGTAAADFEDEVARLAAAIDESRRLRFSPSALAEQAGRFSTQRFLERMQSQIEDLTAVRENPRR